MESSRVLIIVAVVIACLVGHSSAGIRKRDTEDDVKDTLNDAAGSINDAINDVAGATVCATDDQCINVIQYCDTGNLLNLGSPQCAYHGWVLAAVVGAAVLALLTCCVSCFCCPCCCLYSMCKKG